MLTGHSFEIGESVAFNYNGKFRIGTVHTVLPNRVVLEIDPQNDDDSDSPKWTGKKAFKYDGIDGLVHLTPQ